MMSGSQAVVVVLGIAGGLIQGRYISPDIMGRFSAYTILAGYLTFLHFGSLTALQREYPYWTGKGDRQRANRVAAITQGWILVVCTVVGVLYAVLATWCLFHKDWMGAAGWASQLLVTATGYYYLYLGCTYRSSSEFFTWSMVMVLSAVISFALLPLVVWWGFWGLCVRSAVPVLPMMWLLHWHRPVRVPPQFAWRELWAQARFGLPMDMAGFLATSCMLSTLSSMVAFGYGLEVLGLFAFARYAESAMNQFGVSITQVFVPRISHHMGQTESVRSCGVYALRVTALCALAVVAVAAVGALLCGPAVRWLVPNYAEAIPLIHVMLWIALYPVLTLPRYALIAAKRNYAVAAGNAAGYAVFAAIAAGCLWYGTPPIALAWAYMIGKLTHVLVNLVLLLLAMRGDKGDELKVGSQPAAVLAIRQA